MIRTLVLSGGGGRGAFHAGVYDYLCNQVKPGLDAGHAGAWIPDIVVGTSIGAVNGAAIVQGLSAKELKDFWMSLREKDIQGLPPTMTPVVQKVARKIFNTIIGENLPVVDRKVSTSPYHQKWSQFSGMGKFSRWLLGDWCNLLDTGPLRATLTQKLHLDNQVISQSPRTLLITATKVNTGQRVIFSNKYVLSRKTGQPREDVIPGITIDRILASCSIPIVYPWTFDMETRSHYWDGALVSNTPLGVALDAVSDQAAEEQMEVVVVLMTPWREDHTFSPARPERLPEDFNEMITWVLDWTLLSSFRERLELVNAFNTIARLGQATKDPHLSTYREVRVIIVAPEEFFPMARILDYDERSSFLIQQGYQAAQAAFLKRFSQVDPGSD